MGIRKNLFRILLLAILLVCIIPSCKKSTEKIRLQIHFKGGETYKILATIDQKMYQTIQGQRQDITQRMKTETTFNVEKVDTDGVASVKVIYNSILYEQDGPFGKIKYDSSDPPDEVHPMVMGFAAFVGRSISVKMAPDGETKDIQGLDAIWEDMMEKYDQPEVPDSVEEKLREQFGIQVFKEMMEKITDIYPKKPVGIGDSWTKQFAISSPIPMIVENTWTLRDIKREVAIIEVRSVLKTNPESQVEMPPVKYKYDICGNQKGRTVINRSTGWLKKSEVTQKFYGQIEMTISGKSDVISWPISGKTTIKMESF